MPEMPLDATIHYEPHIGQSRQYWRDIILGVNDGLVSTLLLVAGVVGGGLSSTVILLTVLAGAVAGAISMAAGEYLATESQREILDAELRLEREHIRDHREMEVNQLAGMFTDIGVSPENLGMVVDAFSETDEILLNSMKVLEFGVVDSEVRSSYKAMFFSGGLFLVGSLTSVLPFLFDVTPAQGLTIASILTAGGLFIVGWVKASVTKRNRVVDGFANLTIAGFGGILAYFIGNGVQAIIG
jgi:vacuolar iron transporter family protein